MRAVAIWHRTLLIADFVLSIFSEATTGLKLRLAAAFMAYSIAVEYLVMRVDEIRAGLLF